MNKPQPKSPYEPRKPILPKPPAIRSNNSSPYDASGRPKNDGTIKKLQNYALGILNDGTQDRHWEKLSFIIDGDDNEGEEEGYGDKLFEVLAEILHRLEKLESKSHMHRSQLPQYTELGKPLKGRS